MTQYKVFKTERLLLRPTSTEDADFILELLNTPKWLKFVGDRNVRTVEEAKVYIEERMLPQLHTHGYSNYTMIRGDDGKKVGCCGLYDREGLEGVDIGFALLPAYENMGYAFEGSSEIMRAAKDHFSIRIIKGITSQEHLASQKLLKKLGMVCIGKVILPDEEEELLVFETAL